MIRSGSDGIEAELAALFESSFAASEGEAEGRVIRSFVEALLTTTQAEDLFVYSHWDADAPIGVICFSRMWFGTDPRSAFILSPVATAPDRQGQGVGQGLIRHGLDQLRAAGVDYALTYGDPAFYSKVGYRPIGMDFAPPPLPLSFPHGWLGQPLQVAKTDPFPGPSHCVPALNDPGLW